MIRRFLAGVLTAMLAVVGLVVLPTSASADTPVDYVALGDSYASGVGTRDYDPASGSCYRSPEAHPVLWAAANAVSSFAFPACSGATTASLRAGQLGALTAETDLVTVTIGGNDTDFVGTLTTCRLGSTDSCRRAVDRAAAYITTTLPGLLDATYVDIRARAPQAVVVVIGYPRLFELGSCGFGSINATKRALINGGADLLAAVTADRVAAAGFTFLDARDAYTTHGVCGAAPWINGTTVPLTESYHPNDAGQLRAYLPLLETVA